MFLSFFRGRRPAVGDRWQIEGWGSVIVQDVVRRRGVVRVCVSPLREPLVPQELSYMEQEDFLRKSRYDGHV